MNKKNILKNNTTKKIIKTSSESGRSMVEMLGVLAIIGVLSLAGIEGYKYAVAKYKANELLNGVMKRAVLASGYLMSPSNLYQGECCGFSMELPEEENGVYYDAWCSDYDTLVISIDPVSKKTCEIIIKNLPNEVKNHGIGDLNNCWDCGGGMQCSDTNECQDNNEMMFSFYPDLT